MTTGSARGNEVRGLATVGSDVAAVVSARAAGLIVGAASIVLTTRLLGPAGYAEIAYGTVLAILVFTTSSAWTSAAVTRYGREELEREGTLRHTSWARLTLTLPLLVVGCILVTVAALAGLLPTEMSWALVGLAVASGVLLTTSDHLVVVLEAAGRMRMSAVALVLRSALFALALGAFALAGGRISTELVMALTVGASALLTACLTASTWRLALWPPALDRAALRRLLLFSLPMIAFAASQYGMRSVDIVVLGAFEPSESVGVYAAAFQAFVVLSQLATTVTIVLVPLFVSLRHAGRGADVRRYVERLLPQLALLMGVAVAVATPLAALVVVPVLGREYEGAIEPLVILLLALLLRGIGSLAAPVLMLYERSGATATINVAALALNVVGDVLLIGVLGAGVIGAAVASTAALAAIAVGYLIVAGRCLRLRPRLPALIAIAPAGAFAATLALPVGWAIAAAFVAAAVGMAAAIATGLLSPADAGLIARLPLPGSVRGRLLRRLGVAPR
jgi:O-antigen/teichoic acid export membrane protein